MNWKHALFVIVGSFVGAPLAFGQSIALVSQSGGTYDYNLVAPAGVVFENPNTPVIVLSGLSGVTGASVSGALVTGGSGFPVCDLQVTSFTGTSVTVSNNGRVGCAFDSSTSSGTLQITSTVTTAGTVNFAVENTANGAITGITQGPVSTTLTVNILIKPGDTPPATINMQSQGKTPVAILSDATFSAPVNVDTTSLTFGETGDEQSFASCDAPVDVNGDGFLDLVCTFLTQKTGFMASDTQGTLKGKTLGGMALQGTGPVRIIH